MKEIRQSTWPKFKYLWNFGSNVLQKKQGIFIFLLVSHMM